MAFMQSITRSGPTRNPAPRRMRAKCMTFSASFPGPASASGISSMVTGPACSGRGRGRLRLGRDARGLFSDDALHVVLVLEEHAERVVHRLRVEGDLVERDHRVGPVDRLGDARQLVE